jgi:DNA-binding Lrp family transcriptional regulator
MKTLDLEILKIIEENWPISVTEIAKKLGIFKKGMDEKKRKASIGKISYHIKKLKDEEKIMTKKIGQTVIIWPTEIEKLRVLHEMMR